MKKYITGMGVFLLLMSSCLKDGDFSPEALNGVDHSMATLAVFNMVEASDQLDVYLNNELLNKVTETLRYGDVLRHRIVFPGTSVVSARVRRNGDVQMSNPKELSLVAGKNYSLFFYGRYADHSTLVEDNLILPAAGKFKVRFANFNGAGEVTNVGAENELAKYFTRLEPQKVTDFIELEMRESTFVMTAQGQGERALPIQVKPEDKGVYTVLVTAPQIGSGNDAGYSVIRHP